MDSWTRLWFIRFDLGFRFKLFALLKSCNNLNLKPRSNLINPSHVQESFIIIPLLRIFLYFFVYRCCSGNPHKNFEMHAYLKGLHFIIKSVKVARLCRLFDARCARSGPPIHYFMHAMLAQGRLFPFVCLRFRLRILSWFRCSQWRSSRRNHLWQ